jgi:oligopeptide/dipeptide ABC transporter ATP-binding protein
MSLLEIEDLRVEFGRPEDPLTAVRRVDLSIEEGEVLGLVGESGSGKSLTCRAVMRMIPPPGRIASGRIHFDGTDVRALSNSALRRFRASSAGMIYQNPFGSLNPVFSVGTQLTETLRANRGMSRSAAKIEARMLLEHVGIPEPGRWSRSYPHELSGGMCQRVMIALATAAHPRLLLADEPTTALDVTTQAQILKLLIRLQREQQMGILLVSHDFGVIAEVCDRVAVMYGGYIVETGDVETIYREPQHPYTRALLDAVPDLDSSAKARRRSPLSGQPPDLSENLPGCVFEPRCGHSRPGCTEVTMELISMGEGHLSACPVRPFASEDRHAAAADGTKA